MSEQKYMEYACPLCGRCMVRLQDSYGFYLSCVNGDCVGVDQNLCESYIEALSLKTCGLVAALKEAHGYMVLLTNVVVSWSPSEVRKYVQSYERYKERSAIDAVIQRAEGKEVEG